ncbi:hypothetical protein [Rossellomorea marisflavi]|uniref:hypothetical protein n=1 Tax=Rossellomorea marisflavi TaxID=189381 RepID=UPI000A889D1A|nr:hypothetical protein [Rossellomorea marisflavi]
MSKDENVQPKRESDDRDIPNPEKEQTVDSIPLDELHKDLKDEKKKHKSKDSSSSEE